MILKGLLKRLLSNKIIIIFIFAAPILILSLTAGLSGREINMPELTIGIADNDKTILSKAVENEFALWYNCKDIESNDINSKLIEGEIGWVLEIPKGFQDDLQNGIVPEISSHSMQINSVQVLATNQLESMIKSLLALADTTSIEGMPALIDNWQNTSITTITPDIPVSWDTIAYWLGFYGFFSILISVFIINSMMDDRYNGMPERIGTLPITIKSYNLQSILVVFLILCISTLIIVFGIQIIAGYFIKHIIFLLISLILMNLISISLILALFSILKNRDKTLVASSFIVTIFCMVGGVFWPMEFAPKFLQKIAYFSPNYWFSKTLSGCIEPTFDGYYLPLIFMLLFIIIFFLLGSFKRMDVIKR